MMQLPYHAGVGELLLSNTHSSLARSSFQVLSQHWMRSLTAPASAAAASASSST